MRGKSFARLDIAAGVPKMPDPAAAQPAPVSAPAPATPSAPLSALPALAGLPPELLQALGSPGNQATATVAPVAPAAPAARRLPLSYVEFDLQSTATPAEAGAPTP